MHILLPICFLNQDLGSSLQSAILQLIDYLGIIGGRSRTRTYDPLIKSQLLYHLSYAPAL